MRETEILHAVRAALVATGVLTIWRSNTGVLTIWRSNTGVLTIWRSNTGVDIARGVRYGLGIGSADLIGILHASGRFVAFEVKSPTGRQSADQRRWAESVRRAGGFYALVRSPNAALDALARAVAGASS